MTSSVPFDFFFLKKAYWKEVRKRHLANTIKQNQECEEIETDDEKECANYGYVALRIGHTLSHTTRPIRLQ